MLQPQVVDLNASVAGIQKLLARLLREDVQLHCLLRPDAGAIRVDPGQLEQVIMNLGVNARDAMPNGGKLTIETANVDIDVSYTQVHASAKAGRYVMLAVTDTGVGMDAVTQTRIFEPFFTTKDVGTGTGLGLHVAYKIVTAHRGRIEIKSVPGQGTEFTVRVPLDGPRDSM